MKQIYEHNEGLDELAYKLDVRVYKEAQFMIDYQKVTNPCMLKVFEL